MAGNRTGTYNIFGQKGPGLVKTMGRNFRIGWEIGCLCVWIYIYCTGFRQMVEYSQPSRELVKAKGENTYESDTKKGLNFTEKRDIRGFGLYITYWFLVL